jgi:hypothetical protein
MRRLNGSSGSFLYGFGASCAFESWFAGWFGEMGHGLGAGFRCEYGFVPWRARDSARGKARLRLGRRGYPAQSRSAP